VPDPVGYLTESAGFSTFVRDDGAVYHAHFDDLTRIGVPDGLLRNLDWAPKGPRRRRGVAAMDPPPRRVRERLRSTQAAAVSSLGEPLGDELDVQGDEGPEDG
jgi:hypothetical protein